jgi:hypothetical protein
LRKVIDWSLHAKGKLRVLEDLETDLDKVRVTIVETQADEPTQ